MRFRFLGVCAIAVIILCGIIYYLGQKLKEERTEVDRLSQNVTTLTEEAKEGLVRDSLRTSQIGVLQVKLDELEAQRAKDVTLIKDLRFRLKDARELLNVYAEYRDTVVLYVDSSYIVRQKAPILRFSDHWTDISYNPKDSTIAYSFRDSISNILHVEYRKRFLWWRWKPEYKITTVSHNPRCVSIGGDMVIVQK